MSNRLCLGSAPARSPASKDLRESIVPHIIADCVAAMMKPVMPAPARTLAFEILRLVEDGGYAGDLLHARGAALTERDRGLASELVLGSLRRQAQLDFLIGHYSGRAPVKMDREVRIALRMGIYQLRYLTRVPAHAAVSESVELVRRARKSSALGLVNAVLRKVNRWPVAWPDRATQLSLPEWIWTRWVKAFGAEMATSIGEAFLEAPEHYLRVPKGHEEEARLLGARPCPEQGCFLMGSGGAGSFRRQDIGSQSVVPLLDLQPDQRFLDVCSAPGNKTAQALESGVRAVACDVHESRLRDLRGLACRLVVADGTGALPFRGGFERILVDAPCSGTGTLRGNPEIRWRVQAADLVDLHGRQVKILRNSLDQLAPGGRLVYSTCSLETEENEEVVNEVLASAGGRFRLSGQMQRLPGRDAGDGFYAAVLTS